MPELTESERDLLHNALTFYCEEGLASEPEQADEVQALFDKINAGRAAA